MSEAEGGPIAGSPTGASMCYLTMIGGRVVTSECIADILVARHRAGAEIAVDHAAISHLLHDGFVPQPRTVYRDIFAISVGFSARVRQGEIEFQNDFPFTSSRSRCDQVPSTSRLLDCLARSTETACKGVSDPVLLLSAGLDSTSVAVAAKEAGRNDLLCVTYGEPGRHSEAGFAQDVCRRLGLKHETHALDLQSPQICRDLKEYAAVAPEPCADPALTACVSAIRKYGGPGSVVLDGSGSDFYFWSPPRPLDLMKMRFGLSRLPVVRHMRRFVPVYLRHERLLSSPIEPFLMHGAWLRHCDSRRFYPQSVNTHEFWRQEYQAHESLPREEARYRNRAIYVGPGAHMKKTRNAALSVRATARFPWADASVADYCFHLPEHKRFDLRMSKSKILVREMLREKIGYNDTLVGKRPFLFGKRKFLEAHLEFCMDEILSCKLWSSGINASTEQLARMFKLGRSTENTLLALLMVSLWHNHWIGGGLQNSFQETQLRWAI